MKPKFSICMIAKNEEKTLPKFIASAKFKEFKELGGEVCLLDTGSTDNTVKIAKEAGFIVKEVGEKHIHYLTHEEVDKINGMFIVEGEEPVVKYGQRYFHFADARNESASLSSNDMISCVDCDEVFTNLDIDLLNKLIDGGYEQFEYNFVFAHDANGNEAIKFIQSKMYDRRKIQWVNAVHEVLAGVGKRLLLDEDKFKLEHFQQPHDHRSNYLPGLAIDCFNNLNNDRNSHYFAREMMYHRRYRSAIKEFKRHIGMNAWVQERAQSMIFIGDCYGYLGERDNQLYWYNKSIMTDGTRREPFIKLARYYHFIGNPLLTAAYSSAAMQIPWMSFYANDKGMYENEPHEHLYWAKGWLGDIESAKYHILEALKYRPQNSVYLRDLKYYFSEEEEQQIALR